jgi:hypothetical protein
VKLLDLVNTIDLRVRSAGGNLESEVTGGYASDLLSDVLANAAEGDLWVTLQTHENIVAVASMKGIAGIVLVGGREPQKETRLKAEAEGIPILVSDLPSFALVGMLHGLGIRGKVDREPAHEGDTS